MREDKKPPQEEMGVGGKISFALVKTDHKNRKGRNDEMKKREGGISATSEVEGHRGVSERGVGWEMGGILQLCWD